jgi:hypothetical protein
MPIFLVEIPDNITASTLQKTLSNLSNGKVHVTPHHNKNGHLHVEEPKSLLSFDNVTDHIIIKESEPDVDESEESDVDRYFKKYEPPKEPNACSVGGA